MCSNKRVISWKLFLFSKTIRSLKNMIIELGVFFLKSNALSTTLLNVGSSLKIKFVTTCKMPVFLDWIIFYRLISTMARMRKKMKNLSFSEAMNIHNSNTILRDSLLNLIISTWRKKSLTSWCKKAVVLYCETTSILWVQDHGTSEPLRTSWWRVLSS